MEKLGTSHKFLILGPRFAKSNSRISNRLRKKFNDDNRDWLFKNEGLHPGRTYAEPRIYYHEKKDITVNFRFVTRVWTSELDKWLETYEDTQEAKLDLIIMNSLLWDVNRWGPFGILEYKKNLPKLIQRVKSVLAEDGQFIWLTAQPGSKQLDSKAMETPGLEFQKKTTRYNVVEANFWTAHEVAKAGFAVIDLHYYFLLQTFRRNRDGIHWTPEANRYVTNMVLTHVCLADNKELPGRNIGDFALGRVTFMADVAKGKIEENNVGERIRHLQVIADIMAMEGKDQLPPLNELRQRARAQVDDTGLITCSQGVGPIRIRPMNNHGRVGPYERAQPSYDAVSSALHGPPLRPPPPRNSGLRGAYPPPLMGGHQQLNNFRSMDRMHGGPQQYSGGPQQYPGGPQQYSGGPQQYPGGPQNHHRGPQQHYPGGPQHYERGPQHDQGGPNGYYNVRNDIENNYANMQRNMPRQMGPFGRGPENPQNYRPPMPNQQMNPRMFFDLDMGNVNFDNQISNYNDQNFQDDYY